MSTQISKKLGEYLYVPTRELFSWWYKPDSKFTIVGTYPKDEENVLIVSNHRRFIDAWLISSLLSHQRISWCTKVQIHEPAFYHALLSQFESRLARVLGNLIAKQVVSTIASLCIHVMDNCDTFVVDPENLMNPINGNVLSSARSKREAGKWLGIFPEGGVKTPRGQAKFAGMLMLVRTFKLDVHQVYVDYKHMTITFFPPIPSRETHKNLSLIESRLYGEEA